MDNQAEKKIFLGDLSPFTKVVGSDISLEDAVLSSAVFLLWERLYGIATASPTADIMSLYCIQQRNRGATGRAEAGCKSAPPLPRLQAAAAEISSASPAVGSLSSLHKTRPCSHNDVSDEKCVPGGSSGPHRQQTRVSPQQHNLLLRSEDNRRNCFFSVDDVWHDAQELSPSSLESLSSFLPITGDGNKITENTLPPLQTLHLANAEETCVHFFEKGMTQNRGTGLCLKPEVVCEDTWLKRGRTSDVLNLGDDDITSDGVENVVCYNRTVNACQSISKSQHSPPSYSQLQSITVSKRPRFETSMDAEHFASEQAVREGMSFEKGFVHMESRKLKHSEESKNNDEGVIVERFSVMSDGRREMFSLSRSPCCGVKKSVSSTSSQRPPPQAVQEIPVTRECSTPLKDVSHVVELGDGENVKKRVRKYCPPTFYGAQQLCREDEVGVSCCVASPYVEKDKSDSHLTANFEKHSAVVDGRMLNSHDQCNDFTTSPPPSALLASCIPVTPSCSLQRVQQSLPSAQKTALLSFSSLSSSTDGCDEDKVENWNSPKPNARVSNQSACGNKSLSTEKKEKEMPVQTSSPSKADGVDSFHKSWERDILPSELTEVPVPVSPPPSFKDYEWAAKAEEVLERQQKRCRAHTPSTNPPSPPPSLQVGGFELPQAQSWRRPASVPACFLEKDGNGNTKTLHSASKKDGHSRAAFSSTTAAVGATMTQPSKKLFLQTGLCTWKTLSEGQQHGVLESTVGLKKRSRPAAAVSFSVDEFPLPRSVATSEPVMQNKLKGGKRKLKKK